jgi:hypothetical protein
MLAASMKKALPLLLLVFFVVRPAYASDDDDNFRPDVLLCEDAVGKLAECCPDFAAKSVDCTYKIETRDSGCDFLTTTTIEPGLSEAESKYVQGRGDYNTAFPSLGLNGGLRYAF